MKTFKSFLFSLDEVKTVGLKTKLAKTTYMAQMKDPGDLEDVGPEEVGPAGVKSGSGKRPADRLDNKQAFGETAHATIKAKMKEEKDQDALIALYDSLTEENQKIFLENFEKDADKILQFALSLIEE
jgi:hypothetical protein